MEGPGLRSGVMIWDVCGSPLTAEEEGAPSFGGKFQFGVMQMETPCVSFFIQITYKKIVIRVMSKGRTEPRVFNL